MAVEEKGLRAKIELKFKGKSLSKNFKDALAKKWAPKIDTEEDVDDYIDDREDIILETASEGDRIRTEAAKKKPTTTVETVETDEDNDEGKTEMQKLMAEITKLTGVVTGLQQKETQQTIQQQAMKHESLKGIPASYFKGRSLPEKEEDIETWAESLKTDYSEFAAELNIQPKSEEGGESPKFTGHFQTEADTKGKVDPAITKFAAENNKVATKS